MCGIDSWNEDSSRGIYMMRIQMASQEFQHFLHSYTKAMGWILLGLMDSSKKSHCLNTELDPVETERPLDS